MAASAASPPAPPSSPANHAAAREAAMMDRPATPIARLRPPPPREGDTAAPGSRLALEAAKLVKAGQPFVWPGAGLAKPAVEAWTLDYLHEHASDDARFAVRTSAGPFLYADKARNASKYVFEYGVATWETSFTAFYASFLEACMEAGFTAFEPEPGAPVPDPDCTAPRPLRDLLHYAGAPPPPPPPPARGYDAEHPAPCPPFGASGDTARLYLQQTLVTGIGDRLTEDFKAFDWQTLTLLERAGGWGPLTSNLLLIAHRGCTTPLHYDEQQNLFAQVAGRKLVLLASPAHFRCFYPYPLGHSADRQAQVDIRAPDLARFPAAADAAFQYTVLQPGDVLFIPAYWWHHVASCWEETVSLNFWHTAASAARDKGLPELPLRDPVKRVSLRRNIEKVASNLGQERAPVFWRAVASDTCGDDPALAGMQEQVATLLAQLLDQADIAPFMREMAVGRYDLPQMPGALENAPPPPGMDLGGLLTSGAAAGAAAARGGKDGGGGGVGGGCGWLGGAAPPPSSEADSNGRAGAAELRAVADPD